MVGYRVKYATIAVAHIVPGVWLKTVRDSNHSPPSSHTSLLYPPLILFIFLLCFPPSLFFFASSTLFTHDMKYTSSPPSTILCGADVEGFCHGRTDCNTITFNLSSPLILIKPSRIRIRPCHMARTSWLMLRYWF